MSTNGAIMVRSFAAPLEAKEGRIVEGCCVPYGEAAKVRDGDGPTYFEVFEPGCFRRQMQAANRIELRYEHRDGPADCVGIGQSLYEDAAGLFGSFSIYGDPLGDRTLELVRSGVLQGFSIAFTDYHKHWTRTAEGTVVRQNCRLHDVSLVRQPAYAGALVLATRSRAEVMAELDVPVIDDAQLDRLRAVGINA